MIRKFVIIAPVLCSLAGLANAQVGGGAPGGNVSDLNTASFDSATAVAPISIVEGRGVKVGEGTVLHPTFGLETGYVSNTFFTNDAQATGVLRLMAQISAASLSQVRLDPSGDGGDESNPEAASVGAFQYRANARVSYDQMLSGNSTIRSTGGTGLGATFRGMANPQGTFSFGILEDFTRFIRAANFETNDNTNRDINTLNLSLLVHPQGRTLSAYVYYTNAFDIFESSSAQPYPDRMMNLLGAHAIYKLFPRTSVYGDASIGYITALGSSPGSAAKVSSAPLTVRGGVATLLSLKVTANVSAGYTNGFYSAGPSFSAPVFDAALEYRYSPLGKIGAWYSLAYLDSVNANYYRDHVVRAYVEQMFAPFSVLIQPELHFREYQGTTLAGTGAMTVRDDTIFAVIAGMHYNFRNWFAATIDYRLSTVQTSFRYQATGNSTVDPSYVRHELLAGLRIAM